MLPRTHKFEGQKGRSNEERAKMQHPSGDKAQALAEIAQAIEADGVTPQLKISSTQLVFGEGNPYAEVMFIGEAPGKNEDLQGKPFVGAAGKFLDKMLGSIGLERSEIYISNIVKYRPPENRDPTRAEITEFVPYLMRQIDVIRPKLVVFLGRHAMNVFLPELKIGQAHGKPVEMNGQAYLPLFHPAAALYNPGMRETLLADFAKIPTLLKQLS